MSEDIKNRILNPFEFNHLKRALESQGLSITATQEGNTPEGVLGKQIQLNPGAMSIDAIEAARNNLAQQDASSNLLGSLRQQSGQDPVVAQQSQEAIAERLQDPLYKQNAINRFQQPTKDEKRANKKALENRAERKLAEVNNEPSPVVSSQPDYESGQELQQAQKLSNENQLIGNILKASNRINEGLSLTKVGDEAANGLIEQAKQPLERYKQHQEQITHDLGVNKLRTEFNNEKELNDPNSMVSKMTREAMTKLGYTVPEGVSAGILKQSGVNVGTLLGIKESNDTRKEVAKMYADEKKEVSRQSQEAKAEKAAGLSDKQVDAVTTIDDALDAVKFIIKEKPKYHTGRIEGMANKGGQFLNVDDPKYSAFRSQVGEQLAQYIKSISGAAVSVSERQALLENMPNIHDSDETFMEKAKLTMAKLQKHRERLLSNLSKQGKNVKAFDSEKTEAPGAKKIRDPKTGKIHLVPVEHVKDALAAGGEEVG